MPNIFRYSEKVLFRLRTTFGTLDEHFQNIAETGRIFEAVDFIEHRLRIIEKPAQFGGIGGKEFD